MAPRGKSKNRAGRNKEETISPEMESVGSTKEPEQAFTTDLSVTDWRCLLNEEDTELFIAEIVDEWVEHVLNVWYERYLDRATIPYVWEWYKSNILELVRLDQLEPEPGEDPLTDPSWVPDPEPAPIPIDSWAPAAVPFITKEELTQQMDKNMTVSSKSPLQYETVQPLEPLVSDSTIRAQLSSALSIRTDAPAKVEKDLVNCMDDYASSDLSIVTATDSCDWWKWAQSRRLDKQPASQDTSSAEEAAKRIAAADPEPLTGEQDQEEAYRQYMNWVELVSSDEEEEEQVHTEEKVSLKYEAGARVDYQGLNLWEKKYEPEPVVEAVEEPLPATPSTVLSECAECCKDEKEGESTPHGGSATNIPELPAIKKLRALKLSRCSGLLVHSESSDSGDHLPAISSNTAGGAESSPPPAKSNKHHSTTVGRAVDPGHYEQVDIDCDVMDLEKLDTKKTNVRGVAKAPRKKSKQVSSGR